MSGDAYRPVKQGDRPSARVWNDMLKMLAWYKSQAQRISFGSSEFAPDSSIIRVANAAEKDLPLFGIVSFSEPVNFPETADSSEVKDSALATFKSRLAIKAISPVKGEPFGVMLESIEDGADKLGRCVVSGFVQAKVWVTEETQSYVGARAEAGNVDYLLLDETPKNAMVVWREEISVLPGEAWAIIHIGTWHNEYVEAVEVAGTTPDADGLLPGTLLSTFDSTTFTMTGSEEVLILDLNA